MLPLRLLIYDRTCQGRYGLPGLSAAWWAGARLYRALGTLDGFFGASSFAEALRFLAEHEPGRALGQVQFWGHGKWGDARVGAEILDERALLRGHALNSELRAVRARLAPDALWWFRTCETFGAARGQRFARSFTDFMGRRAAGHTYVIGFWQSGLHALEPGQVPAWSADEGLLEGSADSPRRAHWSKPGEPNTISCLKGVLPEWAAQRRLELVSAARPTPTQRDS